MTCNILIVDDEMANRFLLKKWLEILERQTVEAESGVEAIEMFNLHQPQLILMDINMPIMDGVEATNIINQLNFEVPIFAISANSVPVTLEPFDEYFQKPIKLKVFEERLQAHHIF